MLGSLRSACMHSIRGVSRIAKLGVRIRSLRRSLLCVVPRPVLLGKGCLTLQQAASAGRPRHGELSSLQGARERRCACMPRCLEGGPSFIWGLGSLWQRSWNHTLINFKTTPDTCDAYLAGSVCQDAWLTSLSAMCCVCSAWNSLNCLGNCLCQLELAAVGRWGAAENAEQK